VLRTVAPGRLPLSCEGLRYLLIPTTKKKEAEVCIARQANESASLMVAASEHYCFRMQMCDMKRSIVMPRRDARCGKESLINVCFVSNHSDNLEGGSQPHGAVLEHEHRTQQRQGERELWPSTAEYSDPPGDNGVEGREELMQVEATEGTQFGVAC
jgi:hypothetical protein